jgi:hypothetical protein
MLDETCRRELTDGLLFHTENPRRAHRDFIQRVRENMPRLWGSASGRSF